MKYDTLPSPGNDCHVVLSVKYILQMFALLDDKPTHLVPPKVEFCESYLLSKHQASGILVASSDVSRVIFSLQLFIHDIYLTSYILVHLKIQN